MKFREGACYWSYCLLFVVAPVALVAVEMVRVDAPEPLQLSVPTLLFWMLYGWPGEHIYRWWWSRIWGLRNE